MAIEEKILGSLVGVALGDALGMPTEFMTPREIQTAYGYVRSLRAPSASHYHFEFLKRGQFTDDTEQTLSLLDSYFQYRKLDASITAQSLLQWAQRKDVFSLTYLGPSSKRALQRLIKGENPHETGWRGTTIGGAMRMLPVALINLGREKEALETAVEVSLPTHGTNQAIAGASAMACALVEAFKPHPSPSSVIEAACRGAEQGLAHGKPYPGSSISKRIRWAVQLSQKSAGLQNAAQELYDYVGVDMYPREIIPVLLALFSREEDPFELLLAAVNMGGDTDTLASMLGSVLGAFYGVKIFPKELWKEIEAVNEVSFQDYCSKLIQVLQEEGRW